MTDLLIPQDADELAEMIADPKTLQALNEDPKAMAEWTAAYMRAHNKNDPDFQKRVNEEAEKQVKAVLDGEKSNLTQTAKEEVQRELAWALKNADVGKNKSVNRLDLSAGRQRAAATLGSPGWGARNALYNQEAPGARIDNGEIDGKPLFASPAEFLQAIWHKADKLPGNKAEREAKLAAIQKIQNDYGSTIPADGGFLIPETLRSDVMMIALEMSVTRPRATVIPMESLSILLPGVDSTSNVSSVHGGIVCYWTEEGAALTESQAKFRRVKLEAKKLTAYAEVPNELPMDATAFGAFFNQAYPKAMAFYEDDGFMNGSGVGEPFGWLNAAAAVSVDAEAGQPADSIVWENIAHMYARMFPSSLSSAVWVASIDTFPELATMALSIGTGGSAIWLNNGVEGPPVTILGRPVIFTEKSPLLGDAGDINFVDLSYYLIGDRQVMQAESSGHYRFKDDVTAFRFIQRVDGRPWIESAITPKNNGPALSPFVKIAARA